MEFINEVRICGRIVRDLEYSHEFNGVPFYSTDVEIIQVKNDKKPVAKIRCYFSGEQVLSDNNGEVKSDQFINLDGKLVNSKIKGLTDISLLVTYYEIVNNLEEEGLDTHVLVNGEVTKIFTNQDNYKGFVNFVIAQFDENNKRIFSTRVVIWNRLADYVFNNLKVGDKVQIKGGINNSKTKSKVEGEENESVLVSEILGFYFTKL